MVAITWLVEWSGTMGFIKDVIVSVAAVVTATVAWKGLSRWKLEQAGKVQFEVARQLARATYRFRDAMNEARSSFTSPGEFPEGYNPINATHLEKANTWIHVYNNRYMPVREAVSELQAMGIEAEVLWGDEAKQRVTELRKCAGALRHAMREHAFYSGMSEEDQAKHENRYSEYEAIVSGSTDFTDDENEFTGRLRKALSDMQDLLKAHLAKFSL